MIPDSGAIDRDNMQKRNRRILAAALALVAQGTLAQGKLPLCPGTYSASAWTNCQGEQTFPNGRRYVGEFKDGKFSGQGTFTFPGGVRYVGEFKDGTRYGQGTLTY